MKIRQQNVSERNRRMEWKCVENATMISSWRFVPCHKQLTPGTVTHYNSIIEALRLSYFYPFLFPVVTRLRPMVFYVLSAPWRKKEEEEERKRSRWWEIRRLGNRVKSNKTARVLCSRRIPGQPFPVWEIGNKKKHWNGFEKNKNIIITPTKGEEKWKRNGESKMIIAIIIIISVGVENWVVSLSVNYSTTLTGSALQYFQLFYWIATNLPDVPLRVGRG